MKIPAPSLLAAGALATALVAAAPAQAAPVVTTSTGGNIAAIQPEVDAFRNVLGTANGGGPPQASGRRQITWDGVPDIRSAPSFMPEGQFRGVGAEFSTPGLGFEVSADDDNDAGVPDADPDLIDFSDLFANYADVFQPFSGERLFAPINSNISDTSFVLAGTDTPAQTNGFGAVFSDVDLQGPTQLELLDPSGASLGTWAVPAEPGSQTFSFLGVRFDAGERAALARITTGNGPLGVADISGVPTSSDVVAMDDFIFGEPQPIPPAAGPDTSAPQLELDGVSKTVTAKSLAKGLKLALSVNEEANVEARLSAAARSVDFARAKPSVVLAEAETGFFTGSKGLKLRPNAKIVARRARSRHG